MRRQRRTGLSGWLWAWAAAGFLVPGLAAGEEGNGSFQRPGYKDLRYEEDWSGLAGAAEREKTDPFDPIKYIPLDETGEFYLTLGGQARSRVEDFRNFNFGPDATSSDVYWVNRFRLHGDLHMTRYLRAFVEGKSALSSARNLPGGKRTLEVDELALQNAFGDVRIPGGERDGPLLTLRGGRQELAFGKERLVSPLDWSNTRRAWDGGAAILSIARWEVTGFWTQFAPVDKYDFNSSAQSDQLWGVYAEGKLPETGLGSFDLDLYYLGLGRDGSLFNGTAGREDRHTVGGRIGGTAGETGLDFDVEGAYQFGEVVQADIQAFMVSSECGYRLAFAEEHVGKPRLALGFDYASGDDSAGGDVNTFNQLFPFGHYYLGFIDVIGRQNLISPQAILSLEPLARTRFFEKLTLILQGHYFWRASTKDALYNAGGGVVRAGAAGTSRDVGGEVDLVARYPFDPHTLLLVGYSHFFPGEFVRQSGRASDIDFVYLQLQYTF